MKSLNIFGEPLDLCCKDPLTGYFRDGHCRTDESDRGSHVVCAEITEAFLRFSYEMGNDLITPRPEWRFPGLKAGDRWCVCALRWLEAYHAGKAPKVWLTATHERALDYISMEMLLEHAR